MFVEPWLPERRQLEAHARIEHRVRQRDGFGAIETFEKTSHEKRGHLVVGHVAGGVRHDERAPFTGIEFPAVPLSLDQTMREHLLLFGVTLS